MNLLTESNNNATKNIYKETTKDILTLINNEDLKVAIAVENEIEVITKAVDLAFDKAKHGGRVFYFGAGTSGRLGILDACEIRCTYGEVDRVKGIIAGGMDAFLDAAMGDEDNFMAGQADVKLNNVTKNDIVIGIAASGRTPYVIGAVEMANKIGALTIGICNNKNSELEAVCDVTIAVDTGAEVVEGSTRMKAGTAQKIVLNMFSTALMIKLGNVYKNYMINMTPNNEKLRVRAVRTVMKCTEKDEEFCKNVLIKNDWNIKKSIIEITGELI